MVETIWCLSSYVAGAPPGTNIEASALAAEIYLIFGSMTTYTCKEA
jgi:hypothetical protein